MPASRPRYDSYGRPLPTLAEASSWRNMAGSDANMGQRDRILRLVETTLDDNYPHLLRDNVSAEVTLTFKVVRGTIQGQVYVGIVRLYLPEEG